MENETAKSRLVFFKNFRGIFREMLYDRVERQTGR